jgi:glycosyltransferase involved in cell wall biosynthesis
MMSAREPNAVAVRVIDLNQRLCAMTDVTAYKAVRAFVKLNDELIGYVTIGNHHQSIGATRLREAIVHALGPKLLASLLVEHLPLGEGEVGELRRALTPDVPVSVVVATRDRPDDLRRCLACLTAQVSPREIEIVVVDNNPASDTTPPVVAEFPGVVLVGESRKGLSYARNTGIVSSRGEIVVFTDDDVAMPPDWLEKLVAPFAEEGVLAVTGNVLPLELDTTAQQLFEQYGGLGRGFDRRVADGGWFRQFRSAVPTWNLGATANAAFRAAVFCDPRIGLLDEALGAGTPTGCSEDTYLFYKILKAEGTIVYEPAAYVWHRHRRNMASLRRQIYNYSKGHVAYQLTTLIRDGDTRSLVRLAYRLPRLYMGRIVGRVRGWIDDYPWSLLFLEIAGNFVGPFALWQSRRLVRRRGRSEPYVPVAERSAGAKRLPSPDAPEGVLITPASGK